MFGADKKKEAIRLFEKEVELTIKARQELRTEVINFYKTKTAVVEKIAELESILRKRDEIDIDSLSDIATARASVRAFTDIKGIDRSIQNDVSVINNNSTESELLLPIALSTTFGSVASKAILTALKRSAPLGAIPLVGSIGLAIGTLGFFAFSSLAKNRKIVKEIEEQTDGLIIERKNLDKVKNKIKEDRVKLKDARDNLSVFLKMDEGILVDNLQDVVNEVKSVCEIINKTFNYD